MKEDSYEEDVVLSIALFLLSVSAAVGQDIKLQL
jgi:hypothetical protein